MSPTQSHHPLHFPRDTLKLGSSRPWPEVLKKLTGESNLSTKALMTYFKPLLNWLVTENVRHGEVLGWPDFSCSYAGWMDDLTLTPALALGQPQTPLCLSLGQPLP